MIIMSGIGFLLWIFYSISLIRLENKQKKIISEREEYHRNLLKKLGIQDS